MASGCPRVLRVNAAEELPDDLTGIVGVTAGASAPERLVEDVIKRLNPLRGITTLETTKEDEYFPPPPELRDLLHNLEKDQAPEIGAILANDRNISATQVLEDLRLRSVEPEQPLEMKD